MPSTDLSDTLAAWSLGVAIATFLLGAALSVGLFLLGKRLDFRSRMRRAEELSQTVSGLVRAGGDELRDVILMNARRYERDYDGGNDTNRHGSVMAKAELLGVRHSGVDLVCDVVQNWFDSRGRRTLKATSRPAPNILRVGLVPFEFIEHINIHGDEFRAEPIFYVRYKGPGRSPFLSYRYVLSGPVPFGPADRPHFGPVSELGEEHPNRLTSWIRFTLGRWRGGRVERRIERMYRKREG
jgi:hypothetical protein